MSIKDALDFLFPWHTCLVCRGELNSPKNIYLCDACAEKFPINTEPVTLVDDTQKQYFTRAVSAFVYKEPISNMILSLKYSNDSYVANAVAPYMCAMWKKIIGEDYNKKTVLVPVPLCKSRYKKRGYNQAKLLADEVAIYLDLSVDQDILTRTKKTTVQKNMGVKERTENLSDAFAVNKDKEIKGKAFVIIDDVYTTGATANECAKVLIKAGAKRVDILVTARVGYSD